MWLQGMARMERPILKMKTAAGPHMMKVGHLHLADKLKKNVDELNADSTLTDKLKKIVGELNAYSADAEMKTFAQMRRAAGMDSKDVMASNEFTKDKAEANDVEMKGTSDSCSKHPWPTPSRAPPLRQRDLCLWTLIEKMVQEQERDGRRWLIENPQFSEAGRLKIVLLGQGGPRSRLGWT
eukprot:1343699-Heterocapsa_arctica.AAC.1